jgi:hypothetical protein
VLRTGCLAPLGPPRDLLEDGFVQRQVRDQLFELRIFLFQRFEPLDRLFLRTAILLPPAMVGRRADLQLLADFLNALAGRQQRRRFAQLFDDLFGCVVFFSC